MESYVPLDINCDYGILERYIEIPADKRSYFTGYKFVPRNEWMETIRVGDAIRLVNIQTGQFHKGGKITEIGDGWNWVHLKPYSGSQSSYGVSALYYAIWHKPSSKTAAANRLSNIVKLVVNKLDSEG